MKKGLAAILFVVFVRSGTIVCAQTTHSALPDTHAATSVRLSGTLSHYEPSTRVLIVETRDGRVRLSLDATTRIRRGREQLDAALLEHLVGARVIARYTQDADVKSVRSLHVLDLPRHH